MCFTSAGNCYKIDVADVPEARWGEKGAPFKKICPEAGENEKILYILPLGEKMPKGNVLFYTAQGMVKKTAWSEYNVAKSSFQAIKLRDGDRVIGIETETAERTLLFVSRDGMCLNADMNDIPAQGRVSGGVKCINLREGDECTFTGQVSD
ncbi:MAG: DNA gyrase C-terminal beta-propeller domain-containing protein, partial [Christensenellales bacterium]